MIEVGMKNEIQFDIKSTQTAKEMKTGGMEVYSSACLFAAMEEACFELCEKHLDAENTTVGIHMDCSHEKASLVGETVVISCEIIEVNDRKLKFSISGSTQKGIIGRGTHTRFIVNEEKFMKKLL
ncbi:hypothetical protein AN639_00255 [Candidatus Epulonipiscium fishelsonii]|uniref:Uncharacterized protein n=1 Tax=Candidatus Epulonipiscium fishelsonii TaxID=77094 RepID=A0ACC8XF00_9FIRM|nr:hypothetical protein AN396_00555 [Epulopiscium sp. SCG-B11WGA-EpuloA1]ONI43956.1 hypothetical protein AN639_00255 [Epulopiscium sp. SCG-B05WGA-EpuloA1]